MSTTFLPNKELGYPSIGDSGWGTTVDSTFANIDSAFGGNQQFNLTSVSGTVPVSATSYNGNYPANTASFVPKSWTLIGVLTANVTLQLPSGVGGDWIVSNQCALGSFSITVSASGGSSSATLASGNQIVYSDGLGNVAAAVSVASPGVTVENSGSSIGTGFTTLNFVNATSVTGSGGVATITVPTGGGGTSGITIASNGTVVGTSITAVNFINATSVTAAGGTANVTVPSGGGGSGSYLPAAATFIGSFFSTQSFSATTTTYLSFFGSSPSWGTWGGSSMALSTAGTYLISCNVNINATYTASAIGSLLLSVVHNGNAVGQVEALSYSGTAYTYQNQVAAIVNCSVGDTLGGTVYLTNPIGYYSSAYTSGSSNGLQIVKLV